MKVCDLKKCLVIVPEIKSKIRKKTNINTGIVDREVLPNKSLMHFHQKDIKKKDWNEIAKETRLQ